MIYEFLLKFETIFGIESVSSIFELNLIYIYIFYNIFDTL